MPIYVIDKLKPALDKESKKPSFKLADSSDIQDTEDSTVAESLTLARTNINFLTNETNQLKVNTQDLAAKVTALESIDFIEGGTSAQFLNGEPV